MKKPRPEIAQIFDAIKHGTDSRKVTIQIETTLKTLAAKVCRTKNALDFEEVGSRLGRYPKDVSFYLCDCGRIHPGHYPLWTERAKSAMKSPEYKQIQHDKSVKKQKSKLKPPPKIK